MTETDVNNANATERRITLTPVYLPRYKHKKERWGSRSERKRISSQLKAFTAGEAASQCYIQMRRPAISRAVGPVAQWLEPTAHNGLVGGSSPPGPTNDVAFNRSAL